MRNDPGAKQMDTDLEHCVQMYHEEKRKAASSPSREAAEMHEQMAMLYWVQLKHLRRSKQTTVSDDLSR